jgi:hypothetical protein
MTKLLVHHRVRYRTSVDTPWVNSDYAARNIVKAIKKEPFEGYVELSVGGKVRRFDKDNRQELVRVICSDIAGMLKRECANPVTIVPVPNREGLIGFDGGYQTLRLAELIAKKIGGSATDAIRWKEERPKRHKAGGYRTPEPEYENMKIFEEPIEDVVLFDDFLTSGSQLLAATRRLEEAGYNVLFGVTVGRALDVHRDPMLGWENEELQWTELKF